MNEVFEQTEDEGEDKQEKSGRRKHPIADRYTKEYKSMFIT